MTDPYSLQPITYSPVLRYHPDPERRLQSVLNDRAGQNDKFHRVFEGCSEYPYRQHWKGSHDELGACLCHRSVDSGLYRASTRKPSISAIGECFLWS